MNEKLKNIFANLKNGKLVFILGICGILLIFLSTLFTGKQDKGAGETAFDTEEYREQLESNVESVVKSISGAKSVSVMVTLDTGVTYNYADETRYNKSDRQSSDTTDVSTDSENKYIVVTDASGNEKPLIINEQLPLVRGVAVIYSGNGSRVVSEQIKEALMATLDITSKRIYITDTGGY
ncbi:MAG: hypothetical protein U0K54_05145 [Acutalibacteraceae bacterium]|nr:hypothetical protein [Acutalibacteraceae bacterium]